jgi:hypothetical protein
MVKACTGTNASINEIAKQYGLTPQARNLSFILAMSPSRTNDQILAVHRQLQDDIMGHLP